MPFTKKRLFEERTLRVGGDQKPLNLIGLALHAALRFNPAEYCKHKRFWNEQ